ncbi:MAG TPA: hypothetical protein VGB35_11120, partial [Gammaproteobacteria bacterium]
MGHPAPRTLGAQQTLGNQATQRLLRSRAIRAKLSISQPGDLDEQEADRVADQILRMAEPATPEGVTAPASGERPHIQRMCAGCEEEEDEATLQAKGVPEQTPGVGSGVPSQINVLRGGGQPLPESVRAFLE